MSINKGLEKIKNQKRKEIKKEAEERYKSIKKLAEKERRIK